MTNEQILVLCCATTTSPHNNTTETGEYSPRERRLLAYMNISPRHCQQEEKKL